MELKILEAVVMDSGRCWADRARALRDIKDKQLYPMNGRSRFFRYCRRFPWNQNRSLILVRCARALDDLQDFCRQVGVPVDERSITQTTIHRVSRLGERQRSAVMAKAAGLSAGRGVSGRDLLAALNLVVGVAENKGAKAPGARRTVKNCEGIFDYVDTMVVAESLDKNQRDHCSALLRKARTKLTHMIRKMEGG